MGIKKYIFLTGIVSTVIFAGCRQEQDCLDYSILRGDIVREIDLGECYGIMNEGSILISDTIKYKQLSTLADTALTSQMGCGTNPPLPTIDFDTYSLAGVLTSGTGCIVSYEREVTIDTIQKIVKYNIGVHQCGNCNDKRYNMNWVLIHKVDSTYSMQSTIMQK